MTTNLFDNLNEHMEPLRQLLQPLVDANKEFQLKFSKISASLPKIKSSSAVDWDLYKVESTPYSAINPKPQREPDMIIYVFINSDDPTTEKNEM